MVRQLKQAGKAEKIVYGSKVGEGKQKEINKSV